MTSSPDRTRIGVLAPDSELRRWLARPVTLRSYIAILLAINVTILLAVIAVGFAVGGLPKFWL